MEIAKLQTLSNFTKLHTSRDAAVRTSYAISHKTARESKASSDGEFVKESLLYSAALIYFVKRSSFENVSLSDAQRGLKISQEKNRAA